MKVLGLMSGTSMDGLDCCYVDIEIKEEFKLEYEIIDFVLIPFDELLRRDIVDAIDTKNFTIIRNTHNKLGIFYLECCKKILKDRKVDIISMHGQTISHIDGVLSKQIGNPKFLNEYFKVPIIYNFRDI